MAKAKRNCKCYLATFQTYECMNITTTTLYKSNKSCSNNLWYNVTLQEILLNTKVTFTTVPLKLISKLTKALVVTFDVF